MAKGRSRGHEKGQEDNTGFEMHNKCVNRGLRSLKASIGFAIHHRFMSVESHRKGR